MRKPLIICCYLFATLSLVTAQTALAATSNPRTPTKKITKTVKKTVSSRAIANARRNVQLARTSVGPVSQAQPALQSAAVLVLNQETGEVIYQKNADNLTPVASITKLMTAMVVLDAQLPLNELISISDEDLDTLKGTGSRLVPGTTLTRGEMMLLALMSSENRAASALARHYPGGRGQFIQDMNKKARQLGMARSRFFDATGLNPNNVSTPRELAVMVSAARTYPEIQQFSTSSEYSLSAHQNGRILTFHNTNPLVKNEGWEIGVSKTGYISEAGRCLVMQAKINETPVVMVLMDSNGKFTRVGDAQRVKKWMETHSAYKLRAG